MASRPPDGSRPTGTSGVTRTSRRCGNARSTVASWIVGQRAQARHDRVGVEVEQAALADGLAHLGGDGLLGRGVRPLDAHLVDREGRATLAARA